MMEHLSEERLLEIADLGLEDDHVRECTECARAVDEQRAARAALKAAPLLELPRERVQGYVAALPEQTRVRRLRGWPQRLAILAPVAVAAIAILISGRGGDEARVADESAAEDATALSTPAAGEDARSSGPPQLEALPPVALGRDFLVGFDDEASARRAASALRRAGFRVTVERYSGSHPWLAVAQKDLRAEELDAAQERIRGIAREHDGDYLGGQ